MDEVEGEIDDDDAVGSSLQGEEDEDGFAGFGSGEEEDPLATDNEDEHEVEDSEDEDEASHNEDVDDDAISSISGEDSEDETQAEKERKIAFFASGADAGTSEEHTSFLSMNLSRPIIKSITSLGFHAPTPIQAATIPVALLGKDVVGNAVTGSGKTAAFIIPMLERLMYRDRGKNAAATRCVVLVPTRELGVQCFEVGSKLAVHTDIRFCLVVGMCLILF